MFILLSGFLIIYLLVGFIILMVNELTYGKIWDVNPSKIVFMWPYFVIKELKEKE